MERAPKEFSSTAISRVMGAAGMLPLEHTIGQALICGS